MPEKGDRKSNKAPTNPRTNRRPVTRLSGDANRPNSLENPFRDVLSRFDVVYFMNNETAQVNRKGRFSTEDIPPPVVTIE
jgi:hypothetical protein